jgi:hypothetical protein
MYQRISPQDAERIAAMLTTLRPATPFNRLGDLYLAFAQAVAMSPMPQDGGASLAGDLLGTLDDGRRAPHLPHYLPALHLALAAVAERGDVATRARVIAALEGEARRGEWSGINMLAGRGVPLPDTVGDRYLQAMTARVRALTVNSSPNEFGPVFGDFGPLTEYAAMHASRETRDEAITASIALLEHDGQWGARRAEWLFFLVRLLPGSPGRLQDALPCLLRLGKGDFAEPGDFSRFVSNHPLSTIRIDLGSGLNLRARALVGLGALLGMIPAIAHDEIQNLLLSGLCDRELAVREGAVIGIGKVARSVPENWQQRALVQALRDPHESIRTLALEQLALGHS